MTKMSIMKIIGTKEPNTLMLGLSKDAILTIDS
jgi:hypothetical protein